MRNILYVLLLGMTVCVLVASCGGGKARREALLDILSSPPKDGQTDFARLDSLEKVAPDADKHERVVRRLVRAWLTTFETQQAAPDSVTAPIVDYLEKHGTPRERVRALLLHGMGLERRDNAADAQLAYQKALRLARQGGDSTQVLLCWMNYISCAPNCVLRRRKPTGMPCAWPSNWTTLPGCPPAMPTWVACI